MPDQFDPSDFENSPDNSGADHRALLDAIREAAADGVRSEAEPLRKAIDTSVSNHNQAFTKLGGDLDSVHFATERLEEASKKLVWANALNIALVFCAVVAFAFIAAALWRWMQEPVIKREIYGCSAGWDAKKDVCKGKWVPLKETK